jgi:hypothetical protein
MGGGGQGLENRKNIETKLKKLGSKDLYWSHVSRVGIRVDTVMNIQVL